jgi:hypothetical protein
MGKIGPWRISKRILQKLIFLGFTTKNWKIVQFHHRDTFCSQSFLLETPISYEIRVLEHF